MNIASVEISIREPTPDFGRETSTSPMRGSITVTATLPPEPIREADGVVAGGRLWRGGRSVRLTTLGPTDRAHLEVTLTAVLDQLEAMHEPS